MSGFIPCTRRLECKAEHDELIALRTALAEISAAIGTNQYMDPPDGGSVTLAEQVRRMSAALAERQAAIDELVAAYMHGPSRQYADALAIARALATKEPQS